MHPILEEMARAQDVRPGSLRRWTEELRSYVAGLETALAAKQVEIELLKAKKGKAA
jgi:hypothetical protein